MTTSKNTFVKIPKDAKLEEVKVTISQDEDCCSDEPNLIEVSTPDGGGGKYLVMSGKWTFDGNKDIDEFCAFLKDIVEKVGIGNEKV